MDTLSGKEMLQTYLRHSIYGEVGIRRHYRHVLVGGSLLSVARSNRSMIGGWRLTPELAWCRRDVLPLRLRDPCLLLRSPKRRVLMS